MSYQRVEIHFKNGTSTVFEAREFDVNLEEIATNGPLYPRNPTQPVRFTYEALSGEDLPIYLTASEIAGIVVSEVEE